jgi:hypothetical protein
MDTISKLTQETTHGVQDTVSTIGKLADLSTRLTSAIGRFKLGKEYQLPAAEKEYHAPAAESALPALEGFPAITTDITTSDEEIKLGFIE